MNRLLRGWANYFSYGHVTRAYWWVDAFMLEKARRFLGRRHKIYGRGTRRFRLERIFGRKGLVQLADVARRRRSHALA